MSIWKQASAMAAQTPPQRNRYADFLRAMSILFVIVGHWLVAAVFVLPESGAVQVADLQQLRPGTQWISWLFQVMPVFFMVGGYANALSIRSSQAKGIVYAEWLYARLARLMRPLLLLMVTWLVLAFLMRAFDAELETVRYVSQGALVPTWFLAIYTLIVMLAPWSYRLWLQFGYRSWLVFVALSLTVDALYFLQQWHWLGWSNYLWIWLAVHHLGYAWHDGRLPKPHVLLMVSVLAWGALYVAVMLGPYPLSMAGSPDDLVSNTLPPKSVLLLLAVGQLSLLLAIEKPMRSLLNHLGLWTFTVLINSMIMSMYLWHMTVLVVVAGLLYLCGGFGLAIEPGTSIWWATRPLWMIVLMLMLLPMAVLLSPLERMRVSSAQASPSNWRLLSGAFAMGLGVALLALFGLSGQLNDLLRWIAVGLLFFGAMISGVVARR